MEKKMEKPVTKNDVQKQPSGVRLRMLSFVNSSWFYIGLIALIVILVFSSFIFSNGMLSSSDQLTSLDAKVFYRTAIVKFHQFPFWFSTRLGGLPTIDALFGDAMYLPSLIINAILPVEKSVGMRMVFHVFLAGMFFFFLLRKGFGCTRFLSFIGGAFYMISPEFFSHIYPGHDGKMFVIAWLPFIIWRLKALQDKKSFLNASLLGLGIGASLLTSHIQMTYFVMWGIVLYWIVYSVLALKKKETSSAVKFTIYLWTGIILGLAMGLVQLYPSYMFIRDAFSMRGADRGFDYAASWSMHWPEFWSMWVPEFGNTLEYYWGDNPFKLNAEYVGAVTLILAVLAIVVKPKNVWRIFWGSFAVVMLLYAMGAHTPIFQIAYAIVPGVKKFRAPSMIMFWFSFSTILLSALFLKDFLKGQFDLLTDAKRKTWNKGLLITICAVTAITLLFSIKGIATSFADPILSVIPDSRKRQVFEMNYSANFLPFLWMWWLLAAGSLALVLAVIRKKMGVNTAVTLIFILGLIDMVRVDARFIKVINPRQYFYTEPQIQTIQKEMVTSPFRCFTLPGTLPQNGEGIHGIEGVGGFHDNELRWYREFRGDQQDRNYFTNLLQTSPDGQVYLKGENLQYGNSFLDLANVKYILARQNSDLIVIENKNALGRVSFVPGYTVLDSSQIAGALQLGKYDITRLTALLSEPSQKPAVVDTTPARFTSTWEKYTPNDRVVKVNTDRDGFLRISENYYPGWEIRCDGKKVAYYRADLTWMAMFLPSGKHTIEMQPHSLYLGRVIWISAAAMLLLSIYWVAEIVIFTRKKSVKP